MTTPGGIQLNIGAAQSDLAALLSAQQAVASTAEELKAASMKLFNGALEGTGADTGTDFTVQVDAAVASSNEVVRACQQAVTGASDDTISFDQTSFPGVFG